jgi:hypothetical protein
MGYYAVPNESLNLQLELERISVVYKITSQNSEGNLYGKTRLLYQRSLEKTIRAKNP